MAGNFGSCEIVEMAIEIEKNGRDFYGALAGGSSDVALADLFASLSRQEEQHIAVFNSIRDGLKVCDEEEFTNDEYFAYMNALASEHVFIGKGRGKEAALAVKSGREALALALQQEMDSIVFFEGMKDTVDERGKSVIKGIIAQEREHIIKLTHLKNQGKKP